MNRTKNSSTKGRRISWWLLGTAWLVLLILLGVGSLAGYWGQKDWRLDILSHFRLQYLFAAFLLSLLLFLRKRWLLLLPALGLLGLNTYEVFNIPQSISLWRTPALKAMSINVYSRNKEVDRVIAYIRKEKPDFLSLIEITGQWKDGLESLRDLYPYQDVRLYGDNFGSALLSSHPMTDRKYGYAGAGSIVREVQTPAGHITLLLVHPLAPINEKAWGWRNSAFQTFTELIEKTPGPLLLMGDLNCSQWSPNFQAFVENSGLQVPDRRFLPRRTWPAGKPWLWIPIDHFLLSKQLIALEEEVGPSVGSDHYPIVLVFGFAAD